MKICDVDREPEKISIEKVIYGSVFSFAGSYYMLPNPGGFIISNLNHAAVVNLATGEVMYLGFGMYVTVLPNACFNPSLRE